VNAFQDFIVTTSQPKGRFTNYELTFVPEKHHSYRFNLKRCLNILRNIII